MREFFGTPLSACHIVLAFRLFLHPILRCDFVGLQLSTWYLVRLNCGTKNLFLPDLLIFQRQSTVLEEKNKAATYLV
jgi:hypothetical protein